MDISELDYRAWIGISIAVSGTFLLIHWGIRAIARRIQQRISRWKRYWSLRWQKRGGKSVSQVTKAGYVYIIANPGSFGPDVYKVGMTRRHNPLERIKELSDASVPFYYQVHAVIRTQNAPALEARLHADLSDYRVNRANDKKEFFCLPLNELKKIIKAREPQASFRRPKLLDDWRCSKRWNLANRATQW